MTPKLGAGDNYNRVFILGGKGCSDEEIREIFGKFGDIKDVHIIKDKKTSENKGIIYVTYSKASEAALAIEEMNGKSMGENPRPMKVILANDRSEGSVRDPKEDEKMLRLFIIVPSGFTQEDIEKDFRNYGDIEYVRIVKDRGTKEMRLAYVKFYRAYHAALALENCDAHYKPVFAATPSAKGARARSPERSHSFDFGDGYGTGRHSKYSDYASRTPDPRYSATTAYADVSMGVGDMLRAYPNQGEVMLQAVLITSISQELVGKLFDLIPGMEYCHYDPTSGSAVIKYTSAQSAAYARDRLDGFEYPPGYRMAVRYYNDRTVDMHGRYDAYSQESITDSIHTMRQSMTAVSQESDVQSNLQVLVQTIEKASAVLQQAGVGVGGFVTPGTAMLGSPVGDKQYVRYTKVSLPGVKPLAPKDSPVKERLFIVIAPETVPDHVLEDCFCRFGNMISAYFMPGRKYGYVKYADAESARKAIECLHGQTICGNYLKVILADPPKSDHTGKRERSSDYPMADDDVHDRSKMAKVD